MGLLLMWQPFILLPKSTKMTTRERIEGRLLYMEFNRPDVYPFFKFCYLTGIRVEDAFVENWIAFTGNNTISLQPAKHNNVRVIIDAEVYNFAEGNIRRINEITHRLSRHTLKGIAHSYFKDSRPTFRINSIASYIFRYLYVKKLLENGLNAEEIQIAMGHASLSTTLKYISVANSLP